MTSYLSPGVYTKETDFSYYVKQISTSACGMIGIAERGPINKPVLVTSWEQFVRSFGSYIANGYLAYAARAFFDNGGQVLYVNRVAHYTDPTDKTTLTAEKASVALKNRRIVAATLTTGDQDADRIVWTAKTAGTGGNAITVALVVTGSDTPLSVDVLGQAMGAFSVAEKEADVIEELGAVEESPVSGETIQTDHDLVHATVFACNIAVPHVDPSFGRHGLEPGVYPEAHALGDT